MKEADMETIVNWIDRAIVNADNEDALAAIKQEVVAFAKKWILY